MKREQLKKLIKPIIKECIHEVIIEEGILTKVVAEVAKGMGNVIVETKQPEPTPEPQRNTNQEAIELQKKRLAEKRQMLTKAVGEGAYANIFEGIEPMDAPVEGAGAAGPMAGVSAKDPGVDISGIMALGGRNWKTLATAKKR
jgi:hypothetical protein